MTDTKVRRRAILTEHVRVKDLRSQDYAKVDGRWMFVMDVFEDEDEVERAYGSEEWVQQRYVSQFLKRSENTYLVRFIDDVASSVDEVKDVLKTYVAYDLIEIQVEGRELAGSGR